VVTTTNLKLSTAENIDLVKHIFSAKEVPPRLLAKVSEQREFHRPDWPAVVAAVAERLNEFDFYFDFVVEQVSALKAL